MLIGAGVLVLLAIIFSLVDARSAHGRWKIGVTACSLVGGVLLAIWVNSQTTLSLGGYFGMKLAEGAVRAVDFIMVAVMFFLACFGLSMLIGGFISPLKKEEKYNNSVLKLILFGFFALIGAVCLVYFLFVAAGHLIKGGSSALGGFVMIIAGAVYLLIGIGGIAQWNSRRKRISREKTEQKAAAAAEAVAEQPAEKPAEDAHTEHMQ